MPFNVLLHIMHKKFGLSMITRQNRNQYYHNYNHNKNRQHMRISEEFYIPGLKEIYNNPQKFN